MIVGKKNEYFLTFLVNLTAEQSDGMDEDMDVNELDLNASKVDALL